MSARILAFMMMFLCVLNASEVELFKKAQTYEENGDILNAMKLYKKLAEQAIIKDDLKRSERTNLEANLGSPFKNKDINKDPLSSEPFNIDEILGLKTHNLNYLLPASVALKRIEGRKRFETNFQISFQKPLTFNLIGLNETLTLAYTQESWWQTAKSSTPFRETNYRPEIFITFPTNFNAISSLEYIRAGLLHESNGQGGEKSRSWNRAYAESKFKLGELVLLPRAWLRIKEFDNKDDNPDIQKYIGHADIRALYPIKRHFISLMLRNNLHLDNTNKGAAELGWLFPLGNNGFYGYVKYFSGYGESLIDYNRHTNKIGLGFGLMH